MNSIGKAILLIVCFNLAWVGCSRRPRTIPATGVVKMDNKPLADAKVYFSSPSIPQTAVGTTDSAGAFSIAYMNQAGAPAGEYTVAINKRGPDPDNPEVMKEMVPARYNVKSKLTAKVEKGGNNEFTFDLTSEPDAADAGTPANPDDPARDEGR